MLFQIPGVRDPLSPGPTRQQTFPVPPVGQPALDRYAVVQHQNRYLTGPQPQIHSGPTIQATHPTPPVSNPLFNYYRPDVNRYMWEGPDQMFEGATKQQQFIFPPNQPEYRRQSVYNRNQFNSSPTPQFAGDTSTTIFATYTAIGSPGIRMVVRAKEISFAALPITQTDVFTLSQPLLLTPPRWQPPVISYFEGATVQDTSIFTQDVYIEGPTLRIIQSAKEIHQAPAVVTADVYPAPQLPLFSTGRQMPSAAQRFEGATTQQQFLFPPYQPEPQQVSKLIQQNRFLVDAVKYSDGATVQQTHPVPPLSNPLFRYYLPDINRHLWEGPDQLLEGATSQQTFVFPPNQPRREFDSRQPLDATKYFDGAIRDTASFLFPVPQPRRELESRQPVDAVRYSEGATAQQQFIFPPSQPTLIPPRLQPEVVKSFDGATVQQSYIFYPSQPDPTRVLLGLNTSRFLVEAIKQLEGAALQQTFIFPPNQPESSRILIPLNLNRFIVEPPKRFEGFTPVLQSYEFFPNQPETGRFAELSERNRRIVDAIKYFEGAISDSRSFLFPPSQPQLLAPFDINRLVPAARYFEGAITDRTWFGFNVNQAERTRLLLLQNSLRFIVEAARILDGPVIQQQFLFPPSQPQLLGRFDINRIVPACPRFEGAVRDLASFLFPLSQPSGYTVRLSMPEGYQLLDIPPLSDVLASLNQPDSRYRLSRAQPESYLYAQFGGAAVQPTFIFPPAQPEWTYYKPDLNRYLARARQLDEETFVAQTYIFGSLAPEQKYYIRNTFSATFQPVQGPTLHQTYEFFPSQPEQRHYAELYHYLRYFPLGFNVISPTLPGCALVGTTSAAALAGLSSASASTLDASSMALTDVTSGTALVSDKLVGRATTETKRCK